MKKHYGFILSLTLFSLFLSGCTEVTPNNAEVEQGKVIADKQALITFFVPNRVKVSEIKVSLYQVFKERIDKIKKQEKPFPKKLKKIADKPIETRLNYDVSNAYYSLSGIVDRDKAHNAKFEVYKAAIYPYEFGYKVYLHLSYQDNDKSVFGELVSKSSQSFQGSKDVLYYMMRTREKLRELLPTADVIKQRPRKLEKLIL